MLTVAGTDTRIMVCSVGVSNCIASACWYVGNVKCAAMLHVWNTRNMFAVERVAFSSGNGNLTAQTQYRINQVTTSTANFRKPLERPRPFGDQTRTRARARTRTHTRAHTRAHAHAHARTYTHTHTRTYAPPHAHAHAHANAHANAHAHKHRHTHTHTRTRTQAQAQAHARV